jgi:hypothetical protein
MFEPLFGEMDDIISYFEVKAPIAALNVKAITVKPNSF